MNAGLGCQRQLWRAVFASSHEPRSKVPYLSHKISCKLGALGWQTLLRVGRAKRMTGEGALYAEAMAVDVCLAV